MPAIIGSYIGATPPPCGAQRVTQAGVSRLVVLVKVQTEAEELQALVGAGHEQHQELLDYPLVGI